jgi:hypothetical protein
MLNPNGKFDVSPTEFQTTRSDLRKLGDARPIPLM